MRYYKIIDVSQNPNVNMQALKACGVDGVILRAGFGSDISQKDFAFDVCYQNAVSVGLLVGAYWFMYARNIEYAQIEADVCNQVLQGKSFPLGIYYDYEEDSIDYMTRISESKAGMTDRIVAFIERMLSFGWKRVRWYSNPNCIKGCHGADALNLELLKSYGLWLAFWTFDDIEENSTLNYDCITVVGQQYSDLKANYITDINGNCDMSIFNSAVFDYQDEESTQPITPVTEVTPTEYNVQESNTYIVQEGDTLGQIAQDKHTTIEELQRINNIVNPDYIQIGQVIYLSDNSDADKEEEPKYSTRSYTVKVNDSLTSIAVKYHTSVDVIVEANSFINNPNYIQVGWVLTIPC